METFFSMRGAWAQAGAIDTTASAAAAKIVFLYLNCFHFSSFS
jgi:hypothetical protein